MVTDPSLDMAIQALRSGDRAAARETLLQLTAAQPTLPEGWLWLAATSVVPDEKRAHLRHAFALAPHDRRVIAGLRALGETAAEPLPPTVAPLPSVASPAATETIEPTKSAVAPSDSVVQPPSLLTAPRFVATDVQAPRVLPWRLIALVCALVLLIPLSLWLV